MLSVLNVEKYIINININLTWTIRPLPIFATHSIHYKVHLNKRV
ncbi:MAG: hypothetical protein JWP37_4255 [Mucilaginibacter sp.]|nr:hypothetical protein [Mucilaginibacter sp.]